MSSSPEASDPASAAREVLAAEARRAAALVARDLVALEDCLDETLTYVHATGVRHDRAQWLEAVRTGPRFHEVRLEPDLVRIHSDVALVAGRLHLCLQRADGEVVRAESLVTQAWVRRHGGWRLASFQSTRPA
ncbi:MAG: nuclear transport factor 2 family protein [Ramlibacter sp.]